MKKESQFRKHIIPLGNWEKFLLGYVHSWKMLLGISFPPFHRIVDKRCLIDDVSKYFVRAGTVDCTWFRSKYPIKNRIKHAWYDENTYKHDVALFEFTEDIQYSDKMKSIKMADESFSLKVHDIVKVSGFGQTCDTCPDSEKLLGANL